MVAGGLADADGGDFIEVEAPQHTPPDQVRPPVMSSSFRLRFVNANTRFRLPSLKEPWVFRVKCLGIMMSTLVIAKPKPHQPQQIPPEPYDGVFRFRAYSYARS